MQRKEMLDQLNDTSRIWDMIIVGGGATGLGAAVEAISRGFSTLLLEQADFAQGTSSRSTKLIHGGVRYLHQGNISLVLEALRERGLLFHNAPHMVRHQAFIVPNYGWWEGPFYGIGMKLYDVLAGKMGLEASKRLSREDTLKKIPTVEPDGLRGGIIYYDGQFDDARLAITLAKTADNLGACILNYTKVSSILKKGDLVCGVVAREQETGQEYEIKGKTVINATGIFVDSIRKMDIPESEDLISPSQGVHIVIDKSFLPSDSAIMVPHTDDGRVLFAVPWHDRVIIGTTDTEIFESFLEPKPFSHEVEFLLSHAAKYLSKNPIKDDILSVFAGIRPLIRSDTSHETSSLSRDHHITISASGLVTIAGGKWTTYRKMGEDVVGKAIAVAGLDERPSRTEHLNLFGWSADSRGNEPFSVFGSEARDIKQMIKNDPELDQMIHSNLPYRRIEILWAVRHEMARTVEDVLARRTRALILDAKASMEVAPKVATIMAKELSKDKTWEKEQVKNYLTLAQNYLP
ncbi:MAG: glycerol-3-phosphate dehydrogenase/oxidase [Deltaproteobacteria bacterium]|nr:glycerol-3-phosphate dehydrogenase/oxidase [Deltaproteobacteria bacterium]